MDKAHMTRPCDDCPYRLDAPIGHWHRSEFVKVLAGERAALGATFACHKQRSLPVGQRGLCAGFLLDQKARGVPSIQLRLLLCADASAVAAYETAGSDVPMYPDAVAMCRANGVR